jgi:hypothetical protein
MSYWIHPAWAKSVLEGFSASITHDTESSVAHNATAICDAIADSSSQLKGKAYDAFRARFASHEAYYKDCIVRLCELMHSLFDEHQRYIEAYFRDNQDYDQVAIQEQQDTINQELTARTHNFFDFAADYWKDNISHGVSRSDSLMKQYNQLTAQKERLASYDGATKSLYQEAIDYANKLYKCIQSDQTYLHYDQGSGSFVNDDSKWTADCKNLISVDANVIAETGDNGSAKVDDYQDHSSVSQPFISDDPDVDAVLTAGTRGVRFVASNLLNLIPVAGPALDKLVDNLGNTDYWKANGFQWQQALADTMLSEFPDYDALKSSATTVALIQELSSNDSIAKKISVTYSSLLDLVDDASAAAGA